VNTPSLRIGNVTATEGHTSGVNAVFVVSLSAARTETITVASAPGNSTATAGSDQPSHKRHADLRAGETSKPITINAIGDRIAERNETIVVVNLSSPINAIISDGQGLGTIVDDEPRISIGDVT
jgi:hypothetical protein